MSKVYVIPEDTWAIMTICQEASSEPYEGKLAVAEVIRNRTRNKISSDGTVMGTVLAPYQFSGWNTKDINRLRVAKKTIYDPSLVECARAWDEANNSNTDLVKGATHYHTSRLTSDMPAYPEWSKTFKKVATVGAHIFYVP